MFQTTNMYKKFPVPVCWGNWGAREASWPSTSSQTKTCRASGQLIEYRSAWLGRRWTLPETLSYGKTDLFPVEMLPTRSIERIVGQEDHIGDSISLIRLSTHKGEAGPSIRILSGNQTWQLKILFEWRFWRENAVFHCHVWLLEGIYRGLLRKNKSNRCNGSIESVESLVVSAL